MKTAQIIDMNLAKWKTRIDNAREAARETILDYAAECYAFQQECERVSGGSTYTSSMLEWYGIEDTKASMLAKVGAKRESFLAVAKKLPTGLETLYLLCDVPKEVIEKEVTEKTTKRKVRKLKAEYAPPKPTKAEKPAKPAKPKTYSWKTALRDFGGVTAGLGGGNLRTYAARGGVLAFDGKVGEAEARAFALDYVARMNVKAAPVADDIKARVQKAVDIEIARVRKELQQSFAEQVKAEADKRIAEMAATYKAMNEEAEREKAEYERLSQGLEAVMTREEFRTLMSAVHPDRVAPVETRTKAMAILNRMVPRFR